MNTHITDTKYHFKMNVTQFDSHVHFNLFVAPGHNKTYAQTGSLVMRPDEFCEFTKRLFNKEKPIFSSNFQNEIQKLIKGGIYK